MIAEVSTSESFGKLRNYLRQGRAGERVPVADRIEGEATLNLFAGPEQTALLLQEMRDQAARSKQVKKPVEHIILSWKNEDAPPLEKRFEAGQKMLDEMGLAGHQAYLASHQNESTADLHMAVNRVGADGKAWRTSWDFAKAEAAADLVSRKMGFTLIPRHWYSGQVEDAAKREGKTLPRPDRTGPTSAERRKQIETGERPLSERVRESAKAIFDEAGSWRELQKKLRRIRCQVMPKRGGGVVAPSGTKNVEDAPTVKLSSIGRDHSWSKINARFGSFEKYQARQHILSAERRGKAPAAAALAAAHRADEPPADVGEALSMLHRENAPSKANETRYERERGRISGNGRSQSELGSSRAR